MTDTSTQRYSRQMRLPEVGGIGQRKLTEASVLVIGAGGLGAPVLHLLAGAGVGTLGVADFDQVDVSNLHRQTLYATPDIGHDKTEAARRRLEAINPTVAVVVHPGRVTEQTASQLVRGYDLVVDGSDTFSTRYAVNEACVGAGVPVVFASVSAFSGQVAVFGAGSGPCYRCLFPEPPPPEAVPSCDVGGVLGPVPAILGSMQAAEALKLVLGIGEPLIGRVLLMDVLRMTTRTLSVDRDPSCPTCGGLTGSKPTAPALPLDIDADDLHQRLAEADPPVLLDVREAPERASGYLDGPFIPLGQLGVRMDELDRSRPVVTYCWSGARSAVAARLLREHGFDAVSLQGGFEAWDRQRGL